MRKPQRNFVVEFKSGRRRQTSKPVSIWGNLDLKNASAESPSTPSTAPAVSNDFQDLDDEIWQLRRQLAMKLQLQNAQLRKMLERFAR
ncbi:hypothetical protein ACI6PO_27040 (plasmid) [Agrobacterium tumefaciens]